LLILLAEPFDAATGQLGNATCDGASSRANAAQANLRPRNQHRLVSIGDKMTFAKKTFFAGLLVAAASLSAAAQDRVIKFKLAQETHVGSAVLPAGDYRMAVYTDSRIITVLSHEDSRGSSVIAVPIAYDSACSKSSVTLKRDGDQLNLTSVCFGDEQMALYFPSARSRKTQAATQTTATAALAGAQ
jgi:hypothetical protein